MAESGGDNGSMPKRACVSCTQRKIRCDKGSPCSHCRSSGSVCRTSQRQNHEPRSRVIISKEYEKKLDAMGDRLANIETLLQRLSSSARGSTNADVSKHSSGSDHTAAAFTMPSITPPSTSVRSEDDSMYPDPASLDATAGAQSVLASRVVEQAIVDSPATHVHPELHGALAALKEMSARISDKTASLETAQTGWIVNDAEPAPAPTRSEIFTLLQQSEFSLTVKFVIGVSAEVIKARCEEVFNHPKRCSALTQVFVFGLLYELCTELGGKMDAACDLAKRYRVLARVFLRKLELAIGHLPLVTPASLDATVTLNFAASIAVEIGKPYLALTLSSNAASMVVSLGYNRMSSMASDSEHERQRKILLFWMVYWLNTTFTVRLGHAPMIRDHDITVPMLSHGAMIPSSFVDQFHYWVAVSRLQSQAIEQLYSPLAVQQSFTERVRRASRLAHDLNGAWDVREKGAGFKAEDLQNSGLHQLLQWSDRILHQSILALLQHATISAQGDVSPALEPSRNALQLNIDAQRALSHLPDYLWAGHCNWTLLRAPITPFTVTFCHIIAHPLAVGDDLRLLADFVQSLQSLSRFSEGVTKLYQLCDLFHRVARMYVDAKVVEREQLIAVGHHDENQNVGPSHPAMISDIDDYLSIIGLAPPAEMHGTSTVSMTGDGDFDYLNDWYMGNSSLMGFLEQDMAFRNGPDIGDTADATAPTDFTL